jgi:hypothetical protein
VTLPGYCHWRQFRSLDGVLAFSLSRDNAGELLTLARQFDVGGFWYGRRGRPGPEMWDLGNYLGDRGRLPRPLEPWRGGVRPPEALGSVKLAYLKLGPYQGFALIVTWGERRVLILPPGRLPEDLQGFQAAAGLDLLVLPAGLAGNPGLAVLLARLQPAHLVLYGHDSGAATEEIPGLFTRDGAVSVYLAPAAVRVRQWGQ